MGKFGVEDPSQQVPLERREIIEASQKAAEIMAETLGQDANFHSAGAQAGQHAALPLPKDNQQPRHEVKFFLPNKETQATDRSEEDEANDYEGSQPESYDDDDMPYTSDEQYIGQTDDPTWCGDDYNLKATDEEEEEEEEKEELITDILERRAAYLYMAFQPPEPVEGPADTLFIVSRDKRRSERVLVRAHSHVLRRVNDAFNELIGYRAPMVPTPSNPEEEKATGMQISWKQEEVYAPSRMSMYLKLLSDNQKEREDKYLQAVYDYQRQQMNDDPKDKEFQDGLGNDSEQTDRFDRAKLTGNIDQQDGFQGDFAKTAADINTESSPNIKERKASTRINERKSISLELANMVGNLQDSMKPSIVREFLDASSKFVTFPGSEHLPADLKQSFEQFAISLNKFKTTEDLHKEKKVNDTQSESSIDDRSLESTYLGMVGRTSKDMVNILSNINQGIQERRKSKILLEKARQEELEGQPRNTVSATAPRSALERKKSKAYVENQERRASLAPMESLNNIRLITNQDKRTSPSFLERRQTRALQEIAKAIEKEDRNEEEINLRRRNSKAASAAFERRKRLSVLKNKTMKEVEFRGPYHGGLSGATEKFGPSLTAKLKAPGRRASSIAGGFAVPDGKKKKSIRDNHSRRASQAQEMKGSNVIQSWDSRGDNGYSSRMLRASMTEAPRLSHTREEDKDQVVQFYEEENMDIYATSSESSDSSPPSQSLPKDVEFVIEKMHWTCDVLYALMEYIYTETLHIHCVELPDVYRAANEILLSSLTDSIRLRPVIQYFRLAVVNEENRKALLDLADQLTSSAGFENYVNKNEDFVKLKMLCEAFELSTTNPETNPYILLFETANISFKDLPFVTQGLHTIENQLVLILKDPREGTRLFEQNLEQNEYLTFQKKQLDRKGELPTKKLNWLGNWPPIDRTRNRDKAWKVYFFDFSNFIEDIPLRNYTFYKHICALTCRPWGEEEFSLRIVCGLLVCPVLFKAVELAFPELKVMAGRGAGYYLGGETHGNNITLTGKPLYLLRACKAIPRHLVGRTALRVACPSEKTFKMLWMSTNRFGVDLECNVLYFLKPLIQIQKILEYWHGLDMHACYSVKHPREMVELVQPHDPF